MTVDVEVERHNEEQRRYFTGRSLPRMDPAARAVTPYTRRHVDAVVHACDIGPADRILDVGCGPGRYTVCMASAGLAVEGLDLTPGLIAQLRATAPEIPAHVGDIADPPGELVNSFDAVIGFFVLHHVGDLAAVLGGVRSMLKPGGRAAFIEPNPLFPGYYVQITLTPGMSWKGDGGILRMRPALLARAASEAGLANFGTNRFGAFPPTLANHPVGRRIERSLEAVPGWGWARAFQLFTMSAR